MTEPNVKLVYIIGEGRSGSTLLAVLLGGLPGYVPIGELRHLWLRGVLENQLCGCGDPFLECRFWANVGESAFGGWSGQQARRMIELQHQVDRLRWLPRLAGMKLSARTRGLVDEYATTCGLVYAAAARVSGAHTVIDSSKSVAFGAILTRIPGVDPRVIHLVRDSRAVAYSWQRKRLRPEVTGRSQYMETFSPLRSSLLWVSNNGATEALRVYRLPRTRLAYEALVGDEDPKALDGVRGLLGLSSADIAFLRGPQVPVGVQHTVAGNPSRFVQTEVTLHRDNEWLEAMTPRDRRIVAAVTFPLLRAYGYPLRA